MDDNNSVNQLALLRLLQEQGQPAADTLSEADPSEFHRIVTDASKSNPMIKANVTPYSAEDYNKFKTFLTADKQSGYAIKPKTMTEAGKDELISVFSKQKGRGNDILKHAVDVGGAKQLDAFDINNKLPSLYGQEFKETYRYKFDPQYAPSDWDYERLGTPDVIGMELDNSLGKSLKRGARQVGSAALKYGLPATVLSGAASANTADEGIMNTLVPGGVDTAGMSPEDEELLLAEIEARKAYNTSPASMDSIKSNNRSPAIEPKSRDVASENQLLRLNALKKVGR